MGFRDDTRDTLVRHTASLLMEHLYFCLWLPTRVSLSVRAFANSKEPELSRTPRPARYGGKHECKRWTVQYQSYCTGREAQARCRRASAWRRSWCRRLRPRLRGKSPTAGATHEMTIRSRGKTKQEMSRLSCDQWKAHAVKRRGHVCMDVDRVPAEGVWRQRLTHGNTHAQSSTLEASSTRARPNKRTLYIPQSKHAITYLILVAD